jgi:hypothetical protein
MFEKMNNKVFLSFLSRIVKFEERARRSLDGDEVPSSLVSGVSVIGQTTQFASLTFALTFS